MGSQSKKEQDAIKELALLRQQFARLESLDSNRKRTEEKLRESEEKYKTITDAATAAIVMIDGRGKIVFWNPAAERIFGYSVDEAVGKELHLLMAPERYHAQYRKGFQKFKANGYGP
jgi:PAS domain-containing protein